MIKINKYWGLYEDNRYLTTKGFTHKLIHLNCSVAYSLADGTQDSYHLWFPNRLGESAISGVTRYGSFLRCFMCKKAKIPLEVVQKANFITGVK